MSKDEEALAFPKPAQLILPESVERSETIRLIGAVIYQGFKDQPSIAADMPEAEKQRIKHSIRTASTEVLQSRLEAISVQNPGLLARAMRNCGYKVVEREGSMSIESVDEDAPMGGLIGTPIDYDKFMKEIEEDEEK